MGPSVGCRRRNRSLSVPSAWFGLAVSPSRLSPSQPLHYSGTCSRHHFSKVNTSARGRRSAGRRGGRDVRAVESTAHPSGGESAACTQAALASDPFGHVTGSGCARTPAWEVKARVLKEEVRCRRSPVSRVPGPVDLAEVSRRTGGAGIPHHRIGWLGRCPLAPPRRQSFLWPSSNLSGQLLDQGSGRRTGGGRRRRSSASGGFPPAGGRRPRGGVDCTDRTVGSRRCDNREGGRGVGTSRTLLSGTGCPRPLSLLESQAEHGKEEKALVR